MFWASVQVPADTLADSSYPPLLLADSVSVGKAGLFVTKTELCYSPFFPELALEGQNYTTIQNY